MSDGLPNSPATDLGFQHGRWEMAMSSRDELVGELLAEHDRQVAARAWDEGAHWAAVECGAIEHEGEPWLAPGDNPYSITKESI